MFGSIAKEMSRKTFLLSVHVILEMNGDDVRRSAPIWKAEGEIKEALLAVLADKLSGQPQTTVEWEGLSSTPLDDRPQFGRCTVCNRWVYDNDAPPSAYIPQGLCRGAIVNDRLLCDEHLPKDHPAAF